MLKKLSKENIFAQIRTIYIWVYIAFIGLMETTPLCVWTNGASWPSLIYNGLAIGGALLLVWDFIARRVLFKAKYCGILILFLAVTVFSCVLNMKYGIADNVKTLVWSCIQIFLLAAVDTDLPKEKNEKRFRAVMQGLSGLWNVGVLVSLGMFCVFHQGVYYLEGYARVTYEGFCESRLYGVFLDPNYAAMFAFVVLLFSSAMLFRKTAVWEKVFYGISIFINFIYIVLSGSRTVELSMYLCIVLLALWLGWNKLRGKARPLLRVLAALLVAVICLGTVNALFTGSKKVLSYIPAFYRENVQGGDDPATKPGDKDPTHEGGKDHLSGINMNRPDVEYTDDISNNRIAIWTDYIKALPETSFFGTSPRNVISFMKDHFSEDLFVLQKGYGPHNAYLILFVCTGYIGGLLAMAWLVLVVFEILSYLIRKRRQMDATYYQVLFYTLVMVMFAICAMSYAIIFFNNMLITLMFWLLLGHTRSLICCAEPERYEKRPLPYRLAAAIFKKREKE